MMMTLHNYFVTTLAFSAELPRTVVIACMCDVGVSVYQHGRDPLHIPAVSIKPLDTNGAGDTFATTFMIKLANGMSIEDAGMSATWAASRVCTTASFMLLSKLTSHLRICISIFLDTVDLSRLVQFLS